MTAFYAIPKAVTTQAGIKMAQSYRNVQLRTITLHKESCNNLKHTENLSSPPFSQQFVTSSCSEKNESSLRHPVLRFNINFNTIIPSTYGSINWSLSLGVSFEIYFNNM
jgi:hypothetical protein